MSNRPACPAHSRMTKAAFWPSRPPRPNIWDSSQASLGSPKQVQIIEATQMELTNAHSEPYVRHVAAHASTFGTNEKPAVPGCTKYEILLSDFANKSKILMTWPVLCYPVFNAAMTLSFSSRVLSPLSFSMWEELRSWIPRDFAFSWAQAAG